MAIEKPKVVVKRNYEMPHSVEAERALLGCLLMDGKVQVEVFSSLKEDDFYSEAHKYIFNAMAEIIKRNQPLDLVTLSDELEDELFLEKAGGITYLTTLTEIMPSTANYKSYLDIVLKEGVLRRLIKASADIIDECHNEADEKAALAFAEKTVFDISNSVDTSSMVKISKILPDVIAKFDALGKDKNAYKGIRTKFTKLDNLINGLHNSDLMILAARPAVGKTSFAMNIVENVALQGYSCAVFSLEMGKEQLVQRMLCSVANVSMENASKGRLDKTEWLRLAKAREQLNKAKIYIDESAVINPQEIISKCRRLKRKNGLDLVMIDYIQLMTLSNKKTDNRQQEITEISRNLKILAKEVNVPVIALSQLSRAVETRKGRPQLSDLRESGAIEQDADIVMFIHRPDKGATEEDLATGKVQKNVAEIIIEKHRNGPTGLVKLYFKGECTKFLNLTDEGEVEDNGQTYMPKKEVAPVNNADSAVNSSAAATLDDNVPLPSDEDAPPSDDGYYEEETAESSGRETELNKVDIDDELFKNK